MVGEWLRRTERWALKEEERALMIGTELYMTTHGRLRINLLLAKQDGGFRNLGEGKGFQVSVMGDGSGVGGLPILI